MITTFRQYCDRKARETHAEYPSVSVYAALRLQNQREEWAEYVSDVLHAVEAGEEVPPRVWDTWGDPLRRDVLRTSRMLRDDAAAYQLVKRGPARVA